MIQPVLPRSVRQALIAPSLKFFRPYTDANRDIVPTLVANAMLAFLTRVYEWSEALAVAKDKEIGRGREQIKSSQWIVHLLREMESLQNFLVDNVGAAARAEYNLQAIENRGVLSRFAIQILMEQRLPGGGLAFGLEPRTDPAERAFLWGGGSVEMDVRRLDRAAAREALAGVPPLAQWRALPIALPVHLRELLDELSDGATRDVKLTTFIDRLASADVPRLLPVVRRRFFELRVATNLPGNTEGEGRRRRLAYLDRPTPLYALTHDLIEIGWPWFDDPQDSPRALDHGNAPDLETAFADLLVPVVELARRATGADQTAWDNVGGFKPFLGIALRQVGQGREGALEDGVIARVAKAALRQREQIIVLTHHAQTLRHWLDVVEGLGVTDANRGAYVSLVGLGFYGMVDWAKRTTHDRIEGVLFPTEADRRDAGAPVPLAPRLSVTLLRAPYACRRGARRAGRPVYADVTPERVRKLLEIYYAGDETKQVEVLHSFDRVITPELVSLSLKGS